MIKKIDLGIQAPVFSEIGRHLPCLLIYVCKTYEHTRQSIRRCQLIKSGPFQLFDLLAGATARPWGSQPREDSDEIGVGLQVD